jgi:hypothetical protein
MRERLFLMTWPFVRNMMSVIAEYLHASRQHNVKVVIDFDSLEQIAFSLSDEEWVIKLVLFAGCNRIKWFSISYEEYWNVRRCLKGCLRRPEQRV